MKLINPFVIIYLLSTILFIVAVSFLFSMPVAIIYHEPLHPFILSCLITVLLSAILYFISRKSANEKVSTREGFITVSLSWLVLASLGALPFLFSGTIPSFIDAFFESCSGFTTTGASILSDVESFPRSILFWRSFTHWVGGLGIIVFVIVIMPTLHMTASQLLPLESSLKEKIHPKTKSVGLRLLYVYLGLTIIEVILLNLGEMDLFESFCHTFGTVATGGFSTRNDSLTSFSSYTQYIITLFMFLSGVSFVVYYYIVKLNFRKVGHSDEFWFYIGTTLFIGSLATSILLADTTKPLEPAFREGFFQAISMITTTGFSSTDYLLWPHAGIVLIFILMFAGASSGSTTGSIKMVRHLVVMKNIRNAIKRLVHPNIITHIKLNHKPLAERTNISTISFVVLYLFIFLVSTLIIVIIGTDTVTAASAVAASLGNVGPGLGSVGPVFNYSHMPAASKIILSFLMIIGRLEIYTFFILFTRSFWRL
jgi:trk system potassium uptake protein TrkH